jgi:acyl-CoA thioester hydrolase
LHTLDIRVSYADTDQMGMVYYANYLVYFERGRTEWLREKGLAYKELEDMSVYLPVIECQVKYHSPARYDELITVETSLGEVGLATIEFNYSIRHNKRLVATGKTKHPFVNRDLKPIKIPARVREIL